MSCLLCDNCDNLVDTDYDVESLYVPHRECLCLNCRNLLGEFEDDEL